MKIFEFRVIVPTRLDKYSIGNRYMNLEYVKSEAGGGEGIELVQNEKFKNDNEEGQYTYKIFHIKSKIPGFIRWAVPDKYLHFHEKSWNAYPHYNTHNFVPSLGDDFILKVESQHIEYRHGMKFPENALKLSEEELKKRKIWYLDIVDGDPKPSEENLIMEGFSCPEAGISELKGKDGSYDHSKVPEWTKHYNGDMVCCIKVVKFHFKWWGLQKAVEKFVTKSVYPKIFTDSHRKLISTSKDWFQLSYDDILRLEIEAADKQKEGEGFIKDEE
ncbi:hypothetical protein M9Y10_032921 [Tritrichomonas musculus]|uniref:Phosphatidylinositol transfer protein N-terminal domain-containing protein n=1 Tax=Tritrichomonas musculus TaxID=1915356 RepID=A0ABR2GY68_9EUKA